MSVFGSLFTAVSGLAAQSDSISMISNNISNVSTIGYKRIDAAFSSLVTNQSRNTAYSSGSVRSIQNARINQQGILQQSSSPTDVAISGNGFFVVKATASGALVAPLYTRAGSFSEDSSGVLRNAAGFYLQGWPLDQNGNLPASQADVSSLVPVDVAFLGGLTLPTTSAALAMNLDADEDQTDYTTVLPGFTANFTRSLKVFDSLGAGHDLNVNFKKITTPTATVVGARDLTYITGNISDALPATVPPFDPTDSFDITVGAIGPTTIVLDGTVADMLNDINTITDPVSGQLVAFAELDENGFLSIKARNIGDDITLANNTNTPLSAAQLGLLPGAPPAAGYAAPALAANFLLEPLNPNQTPNTEGWWMVDFRTPLGAIITSGALNFDGNGALNAVKDVNQDVLIPLAGIDWGNGSTQQDIDFDISGISQFAGQYNVIASTQNGAELGLRTGVSIDKDGFVTAQFSNGQNSRIFKLALATFANVNGLDEVTGNVYRESDSSGSYNLREAGTGSAGIIASGSLEASNVDLADEFSKMIVTQRSYSASTKVISTADQMMQELLQLR